MVSDGKLFIHVETTGLIEASSMPRIVALLWGYAAKTGVKTEPEKGSVTRVEYISGVENKAERFNGISRTTLAAGKPISTVLALLSADLGKCDTLVGFQLTRFTIPIILNEAKLDGALCATIVAKKHEDLSDGQYPMPMAQWVSRRLGREMDKKNITAKLPMIMEAYYVVKAADASKAEEKAPTAALKTACAKAQRIYLNIPLADRQIARMWGVLEAEDIRQGYSKTLKHYLDVNLTPKEMQRKILERWDYANPVMFARVMSAESERQHSVK